MDIPTVLPPKQSKTKTPINARPPSQKSSDLTDVADLQNRIIGARKKATSHLEIQIQNAESDIKKETLQYEKEKNTEISDAILETISGDCKHDSNVYKPLTHNDEIVDETDIVAIDEITTILDDLEPLIQQWLKSTLLNKGPNIPNIPNYILGERLG